jgi:hypothetical protein
MPAIHPSPDACGGGLHQCRHPGTIRLRHLQLNGAAALAATAGQRRQEGVTVRGQLALLLCRSQAVVEPRWSRCENVRRWLPVASSAPPWKPATCLANRFFSPQLAVHNHVAMQQPGSPGSASTATSAWLRPSVRRRRKSPARRSATRPSTGSSRALSSRHPRHRCRPSTSSNCMGNTRAAVWKSCLMALLATHADEGEPWKTAGWVSNGRAP